MRTMVLEYAHLHLPEQNGPVLVNIPAPWFATGIYHDISMDWSSSRSASRKCVTHAV